MLAILAVLAAACQGPPGKVANKCVEGWPAPSGDSPEPMLGGVTPGTILWVKPVSGGLATDWLVLTDDRIAMTAGSRFYLLDHDGTLLASRASAAFEGVSAPVADADGNFYFAGASIYSVDHDGAFRYMVPLRVDDLPPGGSPPLAGKHLLRSPTGILYVAANDGHLYGIDSRDGARVFRREIGYGIPEPTPAHLRAGVGNAVLAITRGEGAASRFLDAASGLPLATFAGADGQAQHGAFLGRTIGVVTQRMEPTDGPYPWMNIAVLDSCSAPRWTVPATRAQWPALLGPGDELLVVERDDVAGSETFVSIYSPDGARVAGPTPAATPWVAGADGTIYGITCDSDGIDGPSRLIAYTRRMQELWRLDLGLYCPNGSAVIAENGVLYFTRFTGDRTELVAVQTLSPGLSGGSWPTRGRDASGTGWLE